MLPRLLLISFSYLQAIGMLAYAALAAHLFYNFYEFAQKKGTSKALSSNKYQVIVSLAMGCIWRIPSFIETNCVLEEIFRLLKDVSCLLHIRCARYTLPQAPHLTLQLPLGWHRCSSCSHFC